MLQVAQSETLRTISEKNSPDPPILAFFDFLAFFVVRFCFFFCAFSFSKDFRGSAKRKTLSFFGVSLACFQKKQGLEGQGQLVQGCENGDFGNGVFVPYRKQVVLTKNGENEDLQATHKQTSGCARQSPETHKNDQNGGCPSDKPLFAKNTVFATLVSEVPRSSQIAVRRFSCIIT